MLSLKKNHRRASQGMEPLGGARRDGASNRRGPGEPARRSRSPGLSGAQGLGRALRGRVEEPEGVQALPEGLQLPPGMRSTWGGGGGWMEMPYRVGLLQINSPGMAPIKEECCSFGYRFSGF